MRSATIVALVLAMWCVVMPARAADKLGFALEEHATPGELCPAEARPVTIKIRNTGDVAWDPELADRVAYHWRAADGKMLVRDGRRTHLPRAVEPGSAITLDAVVIAPETPGRYRLQWRLVRENVHWYPVPTDATFVVEVRGEPPALAWSLVRAPIPEIGALEEATVEIEVRNDGCAAWNPAIGDRLSYHWYDAEGAVVVAEGARTQVPLVEAGATATIQAKLIGPPRPGPHRLAWELVREDVTWFGPSEPVDIDVGSADLAWSIDSGGELGSLSAGQVVTVPITIRNEGTVVWSRGAGDRVSYRWERGGARLPIEGLRTVLPGAVPPGETVELGVRVAAPDEPGEYVLRFEPVREGVTWFGAPLGPLAPPTVTVGAPELAWELLDLDAPWSLFVGRTAEFELTIRNVGNATWSEAHGDHVSYRIRDADGELLVKDGRRSGFDHDVAPGETIRVTALVEPPPSGGEYVLEFDIVREHVAWYGDSSGAQNPRVTMTVRWWSTMWGAALVVFVIGWVLAERRVLVLRPRVRAVLDLLAWPIWIWIATWVLCEAFADLSGLELWEGGSTVAWSTGALLALIVALVPTRFRPWVALTLAVFWTALAIADLAYVHFFGSLVPITALAALHHLVDARETVGSLLQGSFAWLLVLPASGLPLLARRRANAAAPRRLRIGIALGLAAAAGYAVFAIASASAGRLGARVFSEAQNSGRLGVVGAHLFQLGRAIRHLGGRGELSPAARAQLDEYLAAKATRPVAPHRGAAEGFNLIVLQVEALQGFVVGAKVGDQEVTPYLNAAHEDALYLSNVFDQTAQGRTSDAEYLVLGSGHALPQGALSFLRADNDFETIAHALAGRGYATLSAHPYKRGFWNRASLHPRYGFQSSSFARELGDGPFVGWGLADGPFLERTVASLADSEQPFFAFLITLSLHHPYESFPEGFKQLDLDGLEGTSVGNYLHAMRYFDRSLASFFADLDEAGLRENTVVVLYGDHVSGLKAPPAVLKLAREEGWDPSTPMRLRRVPAWIWAPGSALRGQSKAVGGQIDLGVTALHLLGVDAPPAFVGAPLLGDGPGFAALSGGGAVASDRMFVARGAGIPRAGACFDYPRGTPRPRQDCEEVASTAAEQLAAARTVLDHNLYR